MPVSLNISQSWKQSWIHSNRQVIKIQRLFMAVIWATFLWIQAVGCWKPHAKPIRKWLSEITLHHVYNVCVCLGGGWAGSLGLVKLMTPVPALGHGTVSLPVATGRRRRVLPFTPSPPRPLTFIIISCWECWDWESHVLHNVRAVQPWKQRATVRACECVLHLYTHACPYYSLCKPTHCLFLYICIFLCNCFLHLTIITVC